MTLADLGYIGAPDANKYIHPGPFAPGNILNGGSALTGAVVISNVTTTTEGHVTAFATRSLTPGDIGAATSGHTHLLATGATDVLATAAEVNLLDLSAQAGLANGMVLRATGATTAAWSQPFNDSINNSTLQGWSSQKIQTELNNITSAITGGLINKGGYNAATDVPALEGNPGPLAIKNGWMYTVTADGVFFTEQVRIGDVIIANQDAPTTLAHWTIAQKNIDLASETQTGYVEIATQTETNGGTLDQYYVITPLKLKTYLDFRLASETVQGTAEIATQAEVTTGTDDSRIVSPLKLAQAFAAKLPIQATETTLGIVELATQAECTAGTDDFRAVTPLKMKTYVLSVVPGQTPDADETIRGKVEFATQAEVNAGALHNPYVVSPLTLKTLLDTRVGGYAQDIGDNSATSIAVTHNLNTKDVSVTLYENSTGEEMEAQIVRTSVNVVTVSFNSAPTTAQYRVVIKK
jgi:hypothetical protein